MDYFKVKFRSYKIHDFGIDDTEILNDEEIRQINKDVDIDNISIMRKASKKEVFIRVQIEKIK